jgi:hypothetical protein
MFWIYTKVQMPSFFLIIFWGTSLVINDAFSQTGTTDHVTKVNMEPIQILSSHDKNLLNQFGLFLQKFSQSIVNDKVIYDNSIIINNITYNLDLVQKQSIEIVDLINKPVLIGSPSTDHIIINQESNGNVFSTKRLKIIVLHFERLAGFFGITLKSIIFANYTTNKLK